MTFSSHTRFLLSVGGGALLALAAASAEAATINWATWLSGTPGSTTGSALGTLPGLDASVSYSGQFVGFDDDLDWQPASTFTGALFTGALVGNAPPSGPGVDNDGIMITGGAGTGTNTITFSTSVTNPIVAIWSLGEAGLQAQFVFSSSTLHIRGGGANSEFGGAAIFSGGSCPTGAVCGIEGNGLIHLPGTYSSISWTNPVFDNYYAFTVGVLAAGSEDSTEPDPNTTPFLISAPEPATLVLLGSSLSFIAFQTRRMRRTRRRRSQR